MYTSINFPTKKALKEAVKAGKPVMVYQPNGDLIPQDKSRVASGTVVLEGPHYPKPHSWYAQALIVDGRVVRITS